MALTRSLVPFHSAPVNPSPCSLLILGFAREGKAEAIPVSSGLFRFPLAERNFVAGALEWSLSVVESISLEIIPLDKGHRWRSFRPWDGRGQTN